MKKIISIIVMIVMLHIAVAITNDDLLLGMTRFYCMDTDDRECINGVYNITENNCNFLSIPTANGHTGAYQCVNGAGGAFVNPIRILDQAFTVMTLVETGGGYDFVGWGANCAGSDQALLADSGGTFYVQARTGYLVAAGSTIPGGFVYYFVTHDGTTLTTYINSSTPAGSDNIGTTDEYAADGCLAGRKQMAGGNISQVGFWNRSLSTDEIEYILDNGIHPDEGMSYSTELVLQNMTRGNYSLSSLLETDLFFINSIYKGDGLPIGDGSVCNFSANNITTVQRIINISNYTFSSSSQSLNMTFTESDDGKKDLFRIRTCRETTNSADISIYVNDTLLHTIPSTLIPACPGFHEDFNSSTVYINNDSLAISIRCAACSPSRQIRVIPINTTDIFRYERDLEFHAGAMIFNTSNGMYTYSDHPYVFNDFAVNTTSILGKINVTCNATKGIYALNVLNNNLTINIFELNYLPFVEGTSYQATTSNNITVDISGDILKNITMNVTYSNGSLIAQSNGTEFITFFNDKSGILNISILAYDNDNNPRYKTAWFIMNDTAAPTIYIYPFNSTYNMNGGANVTVNVHFTVTDPNLFAMEYALYSNETLINYTAYLNMTEQFKDENRDFSINNTGVYTLQVNATDDHTNEYIGTFVITSEYRTLSFNFTNAINKLVMPDKQVQIYYTSGGEMTSIAAVQKTDRYSFKLGFTGLSGKTQDTVHKIRIYCGQQYFRPFSKYIGHVVCWDTDTWVDLNNPAVKEFTASPCGTDCIEFGLLMPENKEIIFDSIGKLNNISASANFTVINTTTTTESLTNFTCPSTTSGILLLIFVTAVLFGFIIIGIAARIGFVGIFGALGLFMLSFVVIACHSWTGYAMALGGIALLLWFPLQKIF